VGVGDRVTVEEREERGRRERDCRREREIEQWADGGRQ
jgi:hypothetical protein